jgi:hypothetical protein
MPKPLITQFVCRHCGNRFAQRPAPKKRVSCDTCAIRNRRNFVTMHEVRDRKARTDDCFEMR